MSRAADSSRQSPPRSSQRSTSDRAVTLAEPRTTWGGWIFGSPLLWGLLVTVAFYAAIPYAPIQKEFLNRYFCGHWILYSTTGMFFIGIAILVGKAWSIPSERRAFAFRWLDAPDLRETSDPVHKACQLEDQLDRAPSRVQRTLLVQRYREVCHYLASRGSVDALEDHLKYLADLAADRLHESYALVRTITWAVPILGFLGTVVGITMAVACITPEQLESSLPEVTSGLGVAFDTTALSLSLSMILVFASFIVERAEQRILTRIEHIGVRDLAPEFCPSVEDPILLAQQQVAQKILQEGDRLVANHVALWNRSLESLQTQWNATISQQAQFVSDSLRGGMQDTLKIYADSLAGVQSQLISDTQHTLQHFLQQTETQSQTVASRTEAQIRMTAQVWQELRTELESTRREQRDEARHWLETTAQQLAGPHQQLVLGTQGLAEQLRLLGEHSQSLQQLAQGRQDLLQLQTDLSRNLELLRTSNSFEEALHSLTAAIHLMTARTGGGGESRPRAAA